VPVGVVQQVLSGRQVPDDIIKEIMIEKITLKEVTSTLETE
jgi:hypothetical protein